MRVESSADGAPDYAVRHLAWGNRATAAVGCSLSGPSSSLEVAVVRATGTLELWASAPSGLAPALLCETRLQCRVRALRAARPPGRKGDVLLLLSDVGRLCVLAAQRCGGAVELVCVGSMAAAPEDFGVTLSPTSEPAPLSRRCGRAAHRRRVQAPSR